MITAVTSLVRHNDAYLFIGMSTGDVVVYALTSDGKTGSWKVVGRIEMTLKSSYVALWNLR